MACDCSDPCEDCDCACLGATTPVFVVQCKSCGSCDGECNISEKNKMTQYEIIDNKGNSMLIEAGVSRATFMKLKENLKAPEMCIISHKHLDHYQYFAEYKAMIPTFLQERKKGQTF